MKVINIAPDPIDEEDDTFSLRYLIYGIIGVVAMVFMFMFMHP